MYTKELHEAANQGNSEAQFGIGICYFQGLGIRVDRQEGVRYLTLAADQGHVLSHFNLGAIYSQGYPGIVTNQEKAFHYYKLAADKGEPRSQFNISSFYENGLVVERSATEAFIYCRKAADQGNLLAQNKLGYYFINGIGTERNDKQGFKYYEMAAHRGLAEAQYVVALCYQNGMGVMPNERKAIVYFKLASDQNYALAQLNLAERYKVGQGVPQELETARFFHHKATTVSEDQLPPECKPADISKKITEEAPSLFLKIQEKSSCGIITTSLAEQLVSPEVDLHRSHVLLKAPYAKAQRGPNCGIYALETALTLAHPDHPKIPPARKHAFKPTAKEDKSLSNGINQENIASLRQAAKKHGSVMGEVYDMFCLENAAKEFGFGDCKVFHSQKDSYSNDIVEKIASNHCVILPVDCADSFPTTSGGKRLHYALAWGVIFKNNKAHFLVTHRGKHFLVSSDDLQASHEDMPDTSPSMVCYKDPANDNYSQKQEQKSHDFTIPDSSLRHIPATSLENFKFTALAVPLDHKISMAVTQWEEEKSVCSKTQLDTGLFELRFLFNFDKKKPAAEPPPKQHAQKLPTSRA